MSGPSPIIGPPFTAQMMPSTLSPELREGLAVFFNVDTLGSSYTAPVTALSTASLLPQLSPPLLNGTATYMDAVNSAVHTLKELMNFADVEQSLWNRGRWIDTLTSLQGLSDLKYALQQQSKNELRLYKQQQAQILEFNAGPLTDYNQELSSASTFTFNMYTLQQSYLAGTLTPAQYDLAVGNWNAQVASYNNDLQDAYNNYLDAVNDLNADIQSNNVEIAKLNDTREDNHIDEMIPLQPFITPMPPPTLLPTGLSGSAAMPPPSISPQDLVPSGYPLISSQGVVTSVSTTIDLTPLSPAEAAFFASIKFDIDSLNNGAVFNYNTYLTLALASQETVDMIQALADYQNGSIGAAAYDAAVTNYLDYANNVANPQLTIHGSQLISDTTNYNANLANVNAQIQAFNVDRTALGEPLIPEQVQLNVPALSTLLLPIDIPTSGQPQLITDPFSQITPLLPSTPEGTSTPTNLSGFLSKYYNALFDTQLTAFKAYTGVLSLQEAYRSQLYLVLNGKTNLLPNNSYIERFPQSYFASGPGANPGSSPTAIASSIGIDSRSLSAIISQSILSAALGEFVKSSTQPGVTGTITAAEISDSLTLVALQSLQNASVYAGGPALGLLQNNLEAVSPNSAATDTAVALSALKAITGLIGSGGLEQNVQAALTETLKDAGLDPAQIAEVIKLATSGVSAGLLLFGALAVAKALNLPGLVGQLLGTSFDRENVSTLISKLAGTTINDELTNPIVALFLKDTLANIIESRAIASTRDQSESLANSIINQTLQNRQIDTEIAFQASLNSVLLQNGFNSDAAAEAVTATSAQLRGELQVRGLDTAFSGKALDDQLVRNPSFFETSLQKAVNTIRERGDSFETIRQFRDALSSELQSSGTPSPDAIAKSNQIAFELQSTDLKKSLEQRNIDSQKLASSLTGPLSSSNAETVTQQLLSQRFQSEQAVREALTAKLQGQGLNAVDAQSAASNAVIVSTNADPLKSLGNGDLLTQEQLISRLTRETTNQLKLPLGTEHAQNIAQQLSLLLFGIPQSSSQVYTNNVNNTASVVYQLKDAVESIHKQSNDKSRVALEEQFSDFMKPSVSLLDLNLRFLDPANNLVLSGAWGLMYSGTNAEPSNYKKSIDIRI